MLRTLAMPADTNPNGDIFGGWIMSQMDIGGGIMAKELAKGRICTVSVEGMTFHSPVKVGDEVRYRVDGFDRILRVTKLLKKRVGAPVAATCYEDLTPVRPRVAMPPVMRREPGTGRPTKKERRELDRLLGYDPNFGHKE